MEINNNENKRNARSDEKKPRTHQIKFCLVEKNQRKKQDEKIRRDESKNQLHQLRIEYTPSFIHQTVFINSEDVQQNNNGL